MSTGDRELDELLAGSPELLETARRLLSGRPVAELDPRFRDQLRSRLLAEARRQLSPPDRRRQRLRRGLAWATAGMAATAGAAAVIVTAARSQPHDQITFVTASSPLAEQHAVTGDVITVSFNQPMNRPAVVGGLRIRPATAVRTAWKGNQLLITPIHHLAPNTPYTLTIAESSARATSGHVVKGGVRIAFGTAPIPTPPPGPAPTSPPPTLDLLRLGPIADPSDVLVGQDGTLLASRAIAPVPAASSGTPGLASPQPPPAGSTPSPPAPGTVGTSGRGEGADQDGLVGSSPPASGTVGTPGTPVSLPRLGSALVSLVPGGTSLRIGDAASAIALAPDRTRLAAVVPVGDGVEIEVGQLGAGGLASVSHLTSPVSGIAWRPDGQLAVAMSGSIASVGAGTRPQQLLLTAPGAPVTLAPDGRHAVVGGRIVDLDTGGGRDLRGAQGPVAFSPGGTAVAWFDGTAVEVSPVAADQPARVPLPAGCSAPPAELAVTNDGARVACTSASGGVLALVDTPSGQVLGTTTGASHPAFSGDGGRLGMVVSSGTPGAYTAAEAAVSAPTATRGSEGVPAAALSLLDRVVDAQVRADRAALATLATLGGDPLLATSTPPGLTRGLVIETAPLRGGVMALVRLITDPTTDRPGAAAEESLELQPGGPVGFTVARVTIGPLHDESSGPHVVHVEGGEGTPTVVGFDADLAASTVAGGITVVGADGTPVAGSVSYDADARTATVAIPASPSGPLRLVVGPTLTDIAGQRMTQPFTAPVR